MESIVYIEALKNEINMLKDLKCDNNKNEVEQKIEEKEKLLKRCIDNLNKLKEYKIEYNIYLCILNGLSPSKAVEKVAEENYLNDIKPCSSASLWRYYKNLKKIIK